MNENSRSILIRNARIVNADRTFPGDILISNGKIQAVDENLEKLDSTTIILDADGQYLLPGGIDPHVHMQLPAGGGIFSADDFESGSIAALAGGTTSFIDFVTPERDQPLWDALQQRRKEAERSVCDYALHMTVTRWRESIPAELKQCLEQAGTSSCKVYLAYKKKIGLDDEELLQVLDSAARLGVLIIAHCEHGPTVTYLQNKFISEGKVEPRYHPLSRPPRVEGEAVRRMILMGEASGCPVYIVHVSTREGVDAIRESVSRGQVVLGETCPQYLLLNEDRYNAADFYKTAPYVLSPPLRSETHSLRIWEGLTDGSLRTIGTDHCPFNTIGQKERGIDDFTKIPNGFAGIEHRMQLLYTYGVLPGKISMEQFVSLTAANIARIFGLYPRKGVIRAGADADLVLWDPAREGVISAATQQHNCDATPYEGMRVKGGPRVVIAAGKVVYEEGELHVSRGSGRYLHRNRSFVFGQR